MSCTKIGVGVDNCELWLPPSCHARLDYPHASVVVWGITNAVELAYDGTRVQWTLLCVAYTKTPGILLTLDGQYSQRDQRPSRAVD